MADAKNPCLKCDNLNLDKNNDICAECILRINYVKSIGYYTDNDLNKTNEFKIPATIPKSEPQILSLLQKVRIITCKEKGCNKTKIFAMGFCKPHYLKDLARRKTDGGYTPSLAHMSNRSCSVKGCNEKHHGLGYCEKHYKKIKLISLQINRKLFNRVSEIVLEKYNDVTSNNRIVEIVLEMFIEKK